MAEVTEAPQHDSAPRPRGRPARRDLPKGVTMVGKHFQPRLYYKADGDAAKKYHSLGLFSSADEAAAKIAAAEQIMAAGGERYWEKAKEKEKDRCKRGQVVLHACGRRHVTS